MAFWLPAIALTAVYHSGVSILWQNMTSLFGLTVILIADRLWLKSAMKATWILAGVYILGPISLLICAVLTGTRPFWTMGLKDFLFGVLVCLLPPMTLWLSLLSLQIFSVLAATMALPVLEILRRRPWSNSPHPSVTK